MKTNLARHIAFLSVILVSALLCIANAGSDSFTRYIVSALIHGPPPHTIHLETDTSVLEAARGGNILLRFEGFDEGYPGTPKSRAAFIYYRSAYALYPKRAFVGDSAMLINRSADVISSDFDPDERWMDENDVRSILQVEYRPEAGIRFRVEER